MDAVSAESLEWKENDLRIINEKKKKNLMRAKKNQKWKRCKLGLSVCAGGQSHTLYQCTNREKAKAKTSTVKR